MIDYSESSIQKNCVIGPGIFMNNINWVNFNFRYINYF